MKLNSPQFNLMYKACMKASRVLIRDFGEIEKLQVSEKGPGDFVTASDKRVEKIIIGELEKSKYSILSEEAGIIERHDFKEGKSRYEPLTEEHHDHLIDINSGEIVEFVDKDIEELQKKVAERLGYRLVDHKLELYAQKIKKS